MAYNTLELSELLAEKGYIRGPFGSSLLRKEMLDSGEFAVYEQSNAIKNSREFRFFIDRNKFDELKRFAVRENDLIISCSGTVGRISKIERNSYPGIISQALLILRSNEEIILPDFLKYFLQTKKGQNELLNASHGSVQVNIAPRKIVEKIPIPCPDIKTQDAICKILLAFDTKIKLNQKMNETLEEIAKTLFKSWFIDFDPIRAKAEGKPTGLSKEISDLFPDSFEDSELGDIPKGWKSGNLGDLFEPSRGKIITKAKTNPGNVPVVAGGIKPPYYHSESNVKGPVITISASGTAGYVNLYYRDIWASDCSYVNKDTFKQIFFAHSFFKINQERIYDLRHGAVQQHVYPKDLVELPIVIPPDSLINTYEDIASQLHKKIETNLIESETLNELRDTLLPKLISGELKMPDAENFLKEADT